MSVQYRVKGGDGLVAHGCGVVGDKASVLVTEIASSTIDVPALTPVFGAFPVVVVGCVADERVVTVFADYGSGETQYRQESEVVDGQFVLLMPNASSIRAMTLSTTGDFTGIQCHTARTGPGYFRSECL